MIRRVQLALFVLSGIAALWVAYGSVRAAVYRDAAIDRFDRLEASAPLPAVGGDAAALGDGRPETGADDDDGVGADGVVGVLEIPRLKLTEVVAAGDDDKTLDVAIGHLSDTPLPWASGNSVLAAHRDTHFRPLRDIRHGDLVRLKTRKGVLEYVVKDTLIVAPTDVWVMAPSKTRYLTLVTCYPFNYVGAAPQRFIVRAEGR